MSKITLQSVSKSLGGRDLFADFSLEVSAGARLAVVGPNGRGKTSLLRLMAGQARPDSGKVILSPGARLGYVAQELAGADLDDPLLSFAMADLPSWRDFWRQWEAACQAGDETALRSLGDRQAHLESALGYNPEARAKAILEGLGFGPRSWRGPVAALSGGWRERAKLARVLVAGADVLLLDEPTNHLDLEAVAWLEAYLLGFSGVLVFVAHDRVFLDRVANQTLFLGVDKPVLRPGNLSQMLSWLAQAESQRQRQAAKLSEAMERQMAFVERFRAKATKARQAQSKLKAAAKIQAELEDVRAAMTVPGKVLSFSLPEPARADKNICSAAQLRFAFPDGSQPWPPLTFNIYRGRKIALAGPNGSGKTTLLKLICGELTPSSGTLRLGASVRPGYFSQHQTEILVPGNSVIGEMRRLSDPRTAHEEICSVLGLFLLGEPYFERLVSGLSGGEKTRLLLASLFLSRANFLLLDEPTNHLDLESRQALVDALSDFSGTILFVAHDRHLLAQAAQEVWVAGPAGLSEYPGGFAAYEAAMARATAEGLAAKTQAKPELRTGRREEKRREAKERNAIFQELRPKRERFAALEQELETALARQTGLEEVMADPETYAKSDVFAAYSREYRDLTGRIEEIWQELSGLEEAIRELEGRREDGAQ